MRCTVSNHCSFLDVLVLAALYPTSFVAKEGLRRVPLVSTAADLLGCVYVYQRDRAVAAAVNDGSASGVPHRPTTTADSVGASGAVQPKGDATAAFIGRPPHRADAVRDRMLASARGQDPNIHIFAEGTTSNGTHVAAFKTGAFLAGLPLQPVVVRYSAERFHPAWETIPVLTYMFRLLTQVSSGCYHRHYSRAYPSAYTFVKGVRCVWPRKCA